MISNKNRYDKKIKKFNGGMLDDDGNRRNGDGSART